MSLSKLKNKIIVLYLFLPVLFCYPLIHKGIPITHDAENHISRFAAYYKAMSDGHIPPRWASDLNYTFGIPVLNFFYPLPGYISAVLHSIGLSFEYAYKFLFISSTVISFFTFYMFIKRHTTPGTAGLTSILYALAPYNMLNVYVRGDIGEAIALAILPLVFAAIDVLYDKKSIIAIVLTSTFIGLLILAHNGVSLMTMPFVILYFLIQIHSIADIMRTTAALILGFGFSAFFWIPALTEHTYTLASFFIGDLYKKHTLTLSEILYAPWGFGANVNDTGGQAPQLGIILTILVIAAVYTFFRKITSFSKRKTARIIVFLLAGCIGIFLATSSSGILWDHLSLLRKYQFGWRFLALPTFFFISVIGFLFHTRSILIHIMLITAICIQTIPMTAVSGYISHTDQWYTTFPGTTFYHGEAATRWSTGPASSYPDSPVEIISGKGNITLLERKTQRQMYRAEAATPIQLKFNTLYYPGWKVYSGSTQIPIEFQDPNHRGLITVRLDQGVHNLTLLFTETKLRFAANAISVVSCIVMTCLFIISLFTHRKKRHT